jgi:hypothetical protein
MTEELDLVDEMQWEDVVEFETLEENGLEESNEDDAFDCNGFYYHSLWFYDGDSSVFD